jgi:molybdopterin molybdotransferase
MTGAVLPPGADTVVAQESTTLADGVVTVTGARASGAHVRRRGEDAQIGDEVVPAGVELAARHVAAAATVGVSTVTVFRTPRVGILSTGDELVAVGTELGDGQIFDSNSHFLEGTVRAAGGAPVLLGPVGDTAADLLESLEGQDLDLIVTTGGVSVGAYDVVKEALSGAGVDFMTVAMQPGKPQGLGRVDGRPVLCLPGNPVAVAVSFEMFVDPVIRVMRGLPPYRDWHVANATASWASPAGREQFIPVRWSDGGVEPATARGSGSHLMARLAQADALARVPADVTEVREGDTVVVRRFVG